MSVGGGRQVIESVFKKCIESVNPRSTISQALKISSFSLLAKSETFHINPSTSFVVVGFGKAVLEMARGAQDWDNFNPKKTFLIAPKQFENLPNHISTSHPDTRIFYGAANNLPDLDSVNSTEEIVREIEALDSDDTIFIFLISGGGSALLCSPREGISLEDKQHTIKVMTSKGATIQELNLIRQKLSKVKGGKLLNHIKKGRVISFIISDMIGNCIDLIASGPTVKPKQVLGKEDYLNIFKKLEISPTMIRPSVLKLLEEDDEAKGLDVRRKTNVSNFIVSSNDIALDSIKNSLSSLNYDTHVISSSLSGDATLIGQQFAHLIQSTTSESPKKLREIVERDVENINFHNFPVALVFGGETTVILKGNGKGGRNQEMVLSCLDELQKNPDKIKYQFTFLSAGSDGQDGPTDATGAVISNPDVSISSPSSSEYLARSDSYNFWTKFNNGSSHLKTGSTGTNVMDFQILLLDKIS